MSTNINRINHQYVGFSFIVLSSNIGLSGYTAFVGSEQLIWSFFQAPWRAEFHPHRFCLLQAGAIWGASKSGTFWWCPEKTEMPWNCRNLQDAGVVKTHNFQAENVQQSWRFDTKIGAFTGIPEGPGQSGWGLSVTVTSWSDWLALFEYRESMRKLQ